MGAARLRRARARDGPFDIATDAEDLLALIHELGPPAVAFAAGHGVDVTIRAATIDRDAVRAFVTPGIVTALREHLEGTEGFAASETVTEMLVEQLRRDPRAAVRATVGSLNPQLDEDALRARVDETLAYTSPETTLERIESWLARREPARGAACARRPAGDRLAAGRLVAGRVRFRACASSCRRRGSIEVEDGPLSRPDLAAAVVREMS